MFRNCWIQCLNSQTKDDKHVISWDQRGELSAPLSSFLRSAEGLCSRVKETAVVGRVGQFGLMFVVVYGPCLSPVCLHWRCMMGLPFAWSLRMGTWIDHRNGFWNCTKKLVLDHRHGPTLIFFGAEMVTQCKQCDVCQLHPSDSAESRSWPGSKPSPAVQGPRLHGIFRIEMPCFTRTNADIVVAGVDGFRAGWPLELNKSTRNGGETVRLFELTLNS